MSPVLTPQIADPGVGDYFDGLDEAARGYLLELRALVYSAAAGDPRIDPLSESLKWNSPSYAPAKPGVGTAVRLGEFDDSHVAMFVHCQTTLVSDWREVFPDLTFSKTRAVVLDPGAPLPTAALEQCVGDALTYKVSRPASGR